MIGRDGKLYIIDFNHNDYSDPWEDIKAITWDVEASQMFASGRINGYFESDVPEEFWRIFALYISCGILSSLPWAIPFGEEQIQVMVNQAKKVLSWFDNMRKPIPTWYFKGYYLQYIEGIPFKLKSAFDFSFLSEYGRVFKVFDDQDSGNICFGTEKDGQRYFVSLPVLLLSSTTAILRLRLPD